MRRAFLASILGVVAMSMYACAAGNNVPTGAATTEGAGGTGSVGGAGGLGVTTASASTGPDDDDGGIVVSDAATEEKPIETDAACAAVASEAQATALPVDIIW